VGGTDFAAHAGKIDRAEHQADTSPIDTSDYLRIIAISASSTSVVTWTSELSRCYGLDTRTNLVSGTWSNTLLNAGAGVIPPDGSTTTRTAHGHQQSFLPSPRLQAVDAVTK